MLQAFLPSSSFVSNGAPVLQVRNITDAGYLGGGEVYALDLGQPASPTPVALKLVTGAAFTLPSGTNNVSLQAPPQEARRAAIAAIGRKSLAIAGNNRRSRR